LLLGFGVPRSFGVRTGGAVPAATQFGGNFDDSTGGLAWCVFGVWGGDSSTVPP
jgi:hypothetical protein